LAIYLRHTLDLSLVFITSGEPQAHGDTR